MSRAKKQWIQEAVSKNPGGLHESLHISIAKKIPLKKIKKAEKSDNRIIRKQAQLAETLRHLKRPCGK